MNRRKVESHGLDKIESDLRAGVVAKLDFMGIGGGAPKDEFVADIEKRVGRPISAIRQFKEARGSVFFAVGPNPGRWHQRLGLAQHVSAVPVADRNKARPSKAAAAFDARAEAN